MSLARRRKVGDWMIRTGLVLQLVFLFLVDWGSIVGIADEETLPWGHVAGLIAVNAVLLVSAWFAWAWMQRAQAAQLAEQRQ